MRNTLLIAIIPLVLAHWNPKACNGAGGCTGVGFNPSHPFFCPDGSRLNFPEFSRDQSNAGYGNSEPVSREEFPKTCAKGGVPPAEATFIKAKSRYNQTMYFWVVTNCNDPKPAHPGNCYDFNPNPAVHTFCAMFDPQGGLCQRNTTAGLCERWGYSTVHPQCEFWKPGLEDLPNPPTLFPIED